MIMSEIEVKALEWREWKTERGWQAESALGQYQVSWLGDWECWQCYRPHKNGANWSDNFSKHQSSAEALSAAQSDFDAHIRSAIERKVAPVAYQHRYRRKLSTDWSEWGPYQPALSSYADWEEQMRPLYAALTLPKNEEDRSNA